MPGQHGVPPPPAAYCPPQTARSLFPPLALAPNRSTPHRSPQSSNNKPHPPAKSYQTHKTAAPDRLSAASIPSRLHRENKPRTANRRHSRRAPSRSPTEIPFAQIPAAVHRTSRWLSRRSGLESHRQFPASAASSNSL